MYFQGDPFRYQLKEFSTTEFVKQALESLLRGEMDNDRMSFPASASQPVTSRGPSHR